jgi:putative ABC transport system permease protein
MSALSLALRFAARELRSGIGNFRIFLASLTLGVAAIAGVGSLSDAFLTGLAEQSRTLLGGDVEVQRLYQPANADEHRFFEKAGHISAIATMRSLAQTTDGAKRSLIELKTVDSAYPLLGQAQFSPMTTPQEALACDSSLCGVAVEDALLQRLGLQTGDSIKIGSGEYRIRARIISEPDRISGGFTLGPHVLMSTEGLKRSGLEIEGSLITYSYRIVFSTATTEQAFAASLVKAFPSGRWEVRNRGDAARQVQRFVDQATSFLVLVGLTALIVGGVGAGQAVGAFIERRRATIATLKALGAEGSHIFLIYLLQVVAVALIGILIGLVIGAALPFVVQHFAGDAIPAPAHYAIYPVPLLMAALFGLLSAFGFAILPLGRARDIAPAGLFRDLVAPANQQGRLIYRIMAFAAFAAIAGLTVALSATPRFSLYFMAGATAVLILLRLASILLKRVIARIPHQHPQTLRLAFDNLIRPGTPTSDIIIALGLGLTLLATVTLVESTVQAQVADQLPERAPSFFFVDIQKADYPAFATLVKSFSSTSDFNATPMLRGRIVKLKGVPVTEASIPSGQRWVLDGDRGITYAATAPKDSRIVQGKWWAKDYRGPMLVSFSSSLAADLGLKIGDTVTVNVLGREFTAQIYNLREVDFSSGGINFFMVFSPGVIDAAPFTYLATVRLAPKDEEPLFAAVAKTFPNITAIRVKEALAQVNELLQTLATGIRAASLLTLLSGVLVLAGAIAAGHRARLYEAVILKVLGATRGHLARVYLIEYGFLGALAGSAALGAGTLTAWAVAHFVLDVDFVFDVGAAVFTILAGVLFTLVLGLAGGFAALSAKPAARLRNP